MTQLYVLKKATQFLSSTNRKTKPNLKQNSHLIQNFTLLKLCFLFLFGITSTTLFGQTTTTYNYTGSVQTFTAPHTGKYKLEVWGAQGGAASTYTGGLGGYAGGEYTLTSGQTISIYVGEQGHLPSQGTAWNGGGAGTCCGAGGGGCTDIRISGTALSNRVIVAGAGGGGSSDIPRGNGGDGGGLSGIQGSSDATYLASYPGTQTTGYALGVGESNLSDSGGGGAGYWGGGAGTGPSGGSGGGGSAYIGGVTAGTTIAGNATMPNPAGGSNITGRSGNGIALITVLCDELNINTTPSTTVCPGGTMVTLNATSTNGGTTTWDNGITNGVAFEITETTTYTATSDSEDDCTTSVTITVEDTENPVAAAHDTTLYLDINGQTSLSAAEIDAGSTDNCSIDTIYISQTEFDCDDVDASNPAVVGLKSTEIGMTSTGNLVQLTVVDGSGNNNTVGFTVTVLDTISPVALCQDTTVYLDASGNVSINTTFIDKLSNDACGIATMVLDINTFSCTEIGENTVKLTVSDNNGNTDFCTSTVTVEDNTNPTVLARDTTLYLDANGQATLAAADINDGSTDNCSIINMSIDYNGSNPYDYLTPSTSIIKSFAGREVTFNNLNLNETGQNIITAMPGESITFSTDWTSKYVSTYCPGCSQQFYIGVKGLAIDCMYSGSTNTTRNGSGYINFTAPTTPGLYVVQAGHSLNYTCTTTVDGISDNISEALAYIIVPVQFDCSNVGENSVTLTVTDANGNLASTNATVTVNDTISPTATCQNKTIYLDDNGDASIVAADINNGSSDVCGIAIMTLDTSNFNGSNIGENTVTLTVTDGSGNTDECTSTVTVLDSIDPVITCPAPITVNNDPGACGAVVDYTVSGTDNCSSNLQLSDELINFNTNYANITANIPTPFEFDMDGSGGVNSSSINDGGEDLYDGGNKITTNLSSGDITYSDNAVTPLADFGATGQYFTRKVPNMWIMAAELDNVSSFNINGNLGADGGGTADGYTSTISYGGDTYSIFVKRVFNSNDASVNHLIIIPQNAAANHNFAASTDDDQHQIAGLTSTTKIYYLLFFSGTSATSLFVDNPTMETIATSFLSEIKNINTVQTAGLPSGSEFPVGTTTNTFVATDESGNADTCSFDVTVEDTISPVALCQDTTVYLDANGNVSINTTFIDKLSSDACGIENMVLDINTFSCNEMGENTVKLTVNDNNGNTDFCTATVTVVDNTNPTALANDTTLYLNSDGYASLTAADIDAGSNDNCSIDTMYISQTEFDCDDIGGSSPVVVGLKSAETGIPSTGNLVQLTVVDGTGNSATDWFIVTVLDTISPEALCQDTTVYLDASGNASINTTFIDKLSNDACGIETMVLDINTFSCNEMGENTVKLTVSDKNGNTNFCTSTVTVKDDIDPTAVAHDTTLYLNSNGQAFLSPADIDAGSNDNCSIDTMYLSQDTFNCDNIGASAYGIVGLKSAGGQIAPNGTIVTLTVEDASGNSNTDWFTVTVLDTITPIASCQNISIGVDSEGNATLTADQIDDGSWDACGIQSIELDSTSFTAKNLGNNPVVLTVTDIHGNVSTCSSTVSIGDRSAPHVVCNAMDFVITEDGQYELTSEDMAALSKSTTDNVSAYEDLQITVSPNVFTCEHIGGTTIRVFAEDEAGNGAFCTVEVGVSQINVTPTIDNIADVTASENTSVSIDLSGITDGGDCEAQEITVSAAHSNVSLIAGIDLQYSSGDNTGTLELELMPDHVGSAEIIVKVEDEMGASVSDTFMLTVFESNHSPVLVLPVADQTVKAEATLELSLSKTLGDVFDDVDGDDLTFSVLFEGDTLPSWVNTSEDADFFFVNFTPEQADSGCYNVFVKATDSDNLSASDTFVVCVQQITVGISDLGMGTFEVSMYPNPTKGQVTIETGLVSATNVEVAVMNIAGKEVFRKTFSGSDAIRFNLADRASGMYMVLIEVEGQRVVKKLVLDKN
jgi:hypothetical protein